MARQGGRVQLKQSDMRLVLNVATMAKGGFSRAAMIETQYLTKTPPTEVSDKKKWWVQFPGNLQCECCNGEAAGYPSGKSNWWLRLLPKWHRTESLDTLEAQRHGCTAPRATQKTDTSTNATSARNTTCATQWQWGNGRFRNRRSATRICVYTYFSCQCSIFQSWCICQGLQARYRFQSRFADWWRNIHWLVHYLPRGHAADIQFRDKTSLLSELDCDDEHWWNERDFWVYYYLQLADTWKYILKDIFIWIVKEQCSDEGEITWRRYKGCQTTINGGDGFECSHHVGWCRVERGGAASTLVLVYVSIRLRDS